MPSQSSYFSNNNSDTNHIFYSSCSHFFLSLRFFSYAHHTVLSVRAQLTSKAVPLGRSQKDPLDQLFLSCVTHIGSVGSFMHPLSQQTLEEFTGSHATGILSLVIKNLSDHPFLALSIFLGWVRHQSFIPHLSHHSSLNKLTRPEVKGQVPSRPSPSWEGQRMHSITFLKNSSLQCSLDAHSVALVVSRTI